MNLKNINKKLENNNLKNKSIITEQEYNEMIQKILNVCNRTNL